MDFLAVLTQDEDNNFYIETFKIEEEIQPITGKIPITTTETFEEVQVTHDPKRQLFTIFRYSSVSLFKLPEIQINLFFRCRTHQTVKGTSSRL